MIYRFDGIRDQVATGEPDTGYTVRNTVRDGVSWEQTDEYRMPTPCFSHEHEPKTNTISHRQCPWLWHRFWELHISIHRH